MITINNNHLHKYAKFQLSEPIRSALDRFKHTHIHLPLFQLDANLEKVLALRPLADNIKHRFTDIVLLGTGGSSLGAQLLCKFSRLEDDIRIHFFDNIDPLTFKHFWEKNRLETTLFLVVSKSGSTPETLTQGILSVARVEQALGRQAIADHFIMITEPKDSPLARLALEYGCPCIDHDTQIGGRFSALSLVGLFPAMLMGVAPERAMAGAKHVLAEFLHSMDQHPITESMALFHQLSVQNHMNQTVLMTYVDQLEPLGRWFRQLWAESLGKNGLGTTPINALGTVDQHSQLQLYLDGPKDKVFTVITHPLNWQGEQVSPSISERIGFSFMAGRTMGQLMAAEQQATIQVLQHNNCPTRVIEVKDISPETAGALMMQLMIETILMADILGVNCFDQPAVEQGKILTKELVSQLV